MNQVLETIGAGTLLSTPLPASRFVVDQLLPEGLLILAGAPKVGKSWLALWLCLCVAKGEPMWDFPTAQGGVLYLCLEDSYARIQNRLLDFTDDAPDTLRFATMSEKLRYGLEQQMEDFLSSYPGTTLAVIDTLQRIRTGTNEANPYASDYRDLEILKGLADKHRLAVLLVHHLRKMNDNDPMNMISGTTGISGATDANYVLRKDKRGGSTATLYCTGRDIPYRELSLEFDTANHIWSLRSDSLTQEPEPRDKIISQLPAFLQARGPFVGTATELAEALALRGGEKPLPNVLMKKLLRCQPELTEAGITLTTRRTHQRRELSLSCRRVDCVGNDGKPDSGSLPNLLSQPSQPSQSGGPAPREEPGWEGGSAQEDAQNAL